MFDFLTKSFSTLLSPLLKEKRLTEAHIDQVLTKVHDALLEADVPYEVVQVFLSDLKKDMVGNKVLTSLKPAEQIITTIHQRLTTFLQTGTAITLKPSGVIMMLGLQGSGKTTTIGKLAYYFKKEHKNCKIMTASVDFYRPAAIDQLAVVAQKTGIHHYRAQSQDPVAAAQEIYAHYRQERYDLLLLDTAGRLHVDNQLLQELRAIDTALRPQQKCLVLDGMTGQESLAIAKAFAQTVDYQGAIVTKMDSGARGGAMFAFCYSVKKPILFIGSGEHVEDLEAYKAARIAQRLLGMGDMETLFEKAQGKIELAEQERLTNSFMEGAFTLDDFAKQLAMMNSLGSLSTIVRYVPGLGGQLSSEAIQKGETELKRFNVIMQSMTPKERKLPKIIDNARKKRIARGAGVPVADVALLLSRFEQMQHFAKLMKKGGLWGQLFK